MLTPSRIPSLPVHILYFVFHMRFYLNSVLCGQATVHTLLTESSNQRKGRRKRSETQDLLYTVHARKLRCNLSKCQFFLRTLSLRNTSWVECSLKCLYSPNINPSTFVSSCQCTLLSCTYLLLLILKLLF